MHVRIALLASLALISCGGSAPRNDTPPEPPLPLEARLAQCLKDTGTVLYGASWCHPCHYQLTFFGAYAKSVPYVDCSPPPGLVILPECEALELPGFPTWVFRQGQKDEMRVWQVLPLEMIAVHAGCPL